MWRHRVTCLPPKNASAPWGGPGSRWLHNIIWQVSYIQYLLSCLKSQRSTPYNIVKSGLPWKRVFCRRHLGRRVTAVTDGPPCILCQALCIISDPPVNSNWSCCPLTLNSGQNWRFLSRVTLKFDGWPRKTIEQLFYLTSSFVHHFKAMGEFILNLQSRSAQFGSNFFLSHVTLKFDRWHWKTIGHAFHITSSFVLHFKTIGELKLKLLSGNAQFGSNSAIF